MTTEQQKATRDFLMYGRPHTLKEPRPGRQVLYIEPEGTTVEIYDYKTGQVMSFCTGGIWANCDRDPGDEA